MVSPNFPVSEKSVVMPGSAISKTLPVALTALVLAMAVLAQDRTRLPLVLGAALVAGAIVALLWKRGDLQLVDFLAFAVVIRLAFLAVLPPRPSTPTCYGTERSTFDKRILARLRLGPTRQGSRVPFKLDSRVKMTAQNAV